MNAPTVPGRASAPATVFASAPSPRLGILGGMGPLATAHFYRCLIESTPAHSDQDHLPVAIWADPSVPDRTRALLGRGPSPVPAMLAGLRWLEQAEVTCVAIPCNTAHAYVRELGEHTDVVILDMITAALRSCHTVRPDVRRVGVLATRGTRAARLYEQAGKRLGLDILQVRPDTQERLVDAAISAVKSGGDLDRASRAIAEAARELCDDGAEVAVAACTEIPLVMAQAQAILSIVDSTAALVDHALTYLRASPRVTVRPPDAGSSSRELGA
ncbi:aspartate/glutamate racemase family protein [Embleya sp. NPDC008237]|uniref:aspartate/glutamate racemase family protein n=1 Tax=Embleya sp. NPDC008237 TaxID=3363978 RepID=UPI0036EB3263